MPLTVGTAGHIDHGKTWLVRALTGKDTDRLPEERARGISIDLGYAPLELPDGRQLSLVDVPGHERFVRTMIAGATGIDLFLLVVDAQEGARPQTFEHLAVLRLLGVDRGVVAVTKADAVDEETLELALDEARELVPGAEVVAVSAKTGAGLDELRAALARVPVETRDATAATRLYVDRVFTLQGAGTIATGTLWSGSISAGDTLRVEPRGSTVRVRSVQVHDTAVERAEAGQRVAVNLPTVERRDLARGDVLVEPGHYPVSYRLDVRLEPLQEIPAAVTVHVGTEGRAGARGARRRVRAASTAGASRRSARRSRRSAHRHHRRRRDRARSRAHTSPRTISTGGARPRNAGADRGRSRARACDRRRSAGTRTAFSRRARSGTVVRLLRRRLLLLGSVADGDPGARLRAARGTCGVEPARSRGCRSPSSCRTSRGRRRSSACSTSTAAARRPICRGRRQRSGSAPTRQPSSSRSSHARRSQRSTTSSWQRSSKRRVAFGVSATGMRCRRRCTTAVSSYCRHSTRSPLRHFATRLGVGRRTAQLLLERYDADGVTLRRGDVRTLRRRR